MKIQSFLFLFLCIGLVGWTGCKDDDAAAEVTINYDSANFTAPQLPGGTNRFAAYFPPSQTQPFQGELLERVTFYLSEIPAATTVIIYGEGADNRTPGAELYRKNLTQRIRTTEWIEDRLDTPLEITGEGLWLAIEVDLDVDANSFARSVGCDQGQGYVENGSLLFTSQTREWVSFEELTGDRVNWNIRGILAK